MKNNWNIQYLESCPSTNSTLKQWLESGQAKVGTVLQTPNQTHGRGRYERIWESPKGNLSFSMAISQPAQVDKVYQLNLIAGLSLVKAIQKNYYIDVHLKWPNDVIIHDKKVAGILSESVLSKKAVIVGVGVNLNSSPDDFSADLKPLLSTIRYETGVNIDQDQFLTSYLDIFAKDLAIYFKQGLPAFASAIHANLAWKNQDVIIQDSPGHQYEAKLLQLDEDGFLVVVSKPGCIHKVVAADVRLKNE